MAYKCYHNRHLVNAKSLWTHSRRELSNNECYARLLVLTRRDSALWSGPKWNYMISVFSSLFIVYQGERCIREAFVSQMLVIWIIYKNYFYTPRLSPIWIYCIAFSEKKARMCWHFKLSTIYVSIKKAISKSASLSLNLGPVVIWKSKLAYGKLKTILHSEQD